MMKFFVLFESTIKWKFNNSKLLDLSIVTFYKHFILK